MIAGVLCPRGELTAVHQTRVDTKPPHGKAKITWKDEDMPAKLVRGSKKARAIRLFTPDNADTLVMGEGCETTLSALVANPLPDAAYWVGVDLGNMSGRMQKVKRKRHSGRLDMTDTDAFVPPSWGEKLIFIMDGDSVPEMTRAKLLSGLRRAIASRPGLKGEIVQAGSGVDLNDVLVGEEND